MSLYSWSIKESNCSLCWVGSSSASQAWTHWLRELQSKQRSGSTKRDNYPSLWEAEVKDNKRGECLPRADALSVGSHKSEQGEETLRDEPLQCNHIFIYWSMAEDYSFHVTPFTKVSYSITWAGRNPLSEQSLPSHHQHRNSILDIICVSVKIPDNTRKIKMKFTLKVN